MPTRWAPFGEEEVLRLLSILRVARVLRGARGAPPADIPALARTIARFSTMVEALSPSLEEIDVNPVIAGPDGAVAVDCLIVPRRNA